MVLVWCFIGFYPRNTALAAKHRKRTMRILEITKFDCYANIYLEYGIHFIETSFLYLILVENNEILFKK